MGVFDEFNRFPIFRRGIASNHLNYRYKGKNQFLIDIAAFEGSSGSPILVNLERRFNRQKGEYEQSNLATDVKLVGVLSSGLSKSSGVEIELPMHLGVAIKATELEPLVLALRAKYNI